MHATHIVAYAYDAALHCPHCTSEAVEGGQLKTDETRRMIDCNGLPYVMLDREGNLASPLFSASVEQEECCDDCHEIISGTEGCGRPE